MEIARNINNKLMTVPLFRPILSTLKTPTYYLANYLAPISNPLTKNEYTVKDSFQFAEEICEHYLWVV